MTNLSPQQRDAIGKIQRWYENDPIEPFRLFGPAGTGKTTLAREVPAALGLDFGTDAGVLYGAYTGKAANVLRRKGCTPASTLHSLVYRPVSNTEIMIELEAARAELAELEALRQFMTNEPEPAVAGGALVLAGWADMLEFHGAYDKTQERVAQLEKDSQNTIGWEWNQDSPLAGASLLILDEVSMVDAKLAADIERFGVPVLVLGDPEQLEPVGGEGYYIDAAPDYALTEIHRQALESPVLELATRVRTSINSDLALNPGDTRPRKLSEAMAADQILCWKNATRWNLINRIRTQLGRPAGEVVTGDRIMCLTNNRSMGVFNGQQFDVIGARGDNLGWVLDVLDDAGVRRTIKSFPDGFEGRVQQDAAKKLNVGGRRDRGLFTFANAITVHKAQGSEWPHVYVVNESQELLSMTASRKGAAAGIQSARRWLYTAATRASDRLTLTDW